MVVFRAVIALTAVLLLECADSAGAAAISVYWNDIALDEIRKTGYDSAMSSRVLAIMHTAMYDAWTTYALSAAPTLPNGILKRPPEEMTDSNKIEAVSFAARKALVDMFPLMASKTDAALTALGFDLEDVQCADTATPSGIGNVAAETVIAVRHNVATTYPGEGPMPASINAYDAFANSSIVPILAHDPTNNADDWQPSHVVDTQRGLVAQEGSAN